MRAALVEAVGSPPVAADWDEPPREDGTALVAVEAAPLNPVEIRVAAGRHARRPEPPYVPGLEGAGTVVESARLPAGTRVRFEGAALPGFGAQGTLAGRAVVPEESIVELPDEVEADFAAALGVVGITHCSRSSAPRRPAANECSSSARPAPSGRWRCSWRS